MRKGCWSCTIKHLGEAAIFQTELPVYANFAVYVIGSLSHAAMEVEEFHPELAKVIRDWRLRFESDVNVKIPYEELYSYIQVCQAAAKQGIEYPEILGFQALTDTPEELTQGLPPPTCPLPIPEGWERVFAGEVFPGDMEYNTAKGSWIVVTSVNGTMAGNPFRIVIRKDKPAEPVEDKPEPKQDDPTPVNTERVTEGNVEPYDIILMDGKWLTIPPTGCGVGAPVSCYAEVRRSPALPIPGGWELVTEGVSQAGDKFWSEFSDEWRGVEATLGQSHTHYGNTLIRKRPALPEQVRPGPPPLPEVLEGWHLLTDGKLQLGDLVVAYGSGVWEPATGNIVGGYAAGWRAAIRHTCVVDTGPDLAWPKDTVPYKVAPKPPDLPVPEGYELITGGEVKVGDFVQYSNPQYWGMRFEQGDVAYNEVGLAVTDSTIHSVVRKIPDPVAPRTEADWQATLAQEFHPDPVEMPVLEDKVEGETYPYTLTQGDLKGTTLQIPAGYHVVTTGEVYPDDLVYDPVAKEFGVSDLIELQEPVSEFLCLLRKDPEAVAGVEGQAGPVVEAEAESGATVAAGFGGLSKAGPVPEGWYQVTSGVMKVGDKLQSVVNPEKWHDIQADSLSLGMAVKFYPCVLRKCAGGFVTITLHSGEKQSVQLPEGWERVTGGKVLAGDKTWQAPARVFTEVQDGDEIGDDVDEFYLCIRQKATTT